MEEWRAKEAEAAEKVAAMGAKIEGTQDAAARLEAQIDSMRGDAQEVVRLTEHNQRLEAEVSEGKYRAEAMQEALEAELDSV